MRSPFSQIFILASKKLVKSLKSKQKRRKQNEVWRVYPKTIILTLDRKIWVKLRSCTSIVAKIKSTKWTGKRAAAITARSLYCSSECVRQPTQKKAVFARFPSLLEHVVRVWKEEETAILPFSFFSHNPWEEMIPFWVILTFFQDESQVVPALLHTPKTVGFFRWDQIWNNVQHDGLRWNVALPLRFKYTRVKNFWFGCCLCEMPMPLAAALEKLSHFGTCVMRQRKWALRWWRLGWLHKVHMLRQ